MVYLYRFLCVSGMQLQAHHTQLSHDRFTLYYIHKVIFQLVEEVMATGSAGNIHCCLFEAVVDAKERKRSRRSVVTMINFLKDTVVDVAVFNRDSKL